MQNSAAPELRYTRYVGKFPIEGICTSCLNISFKAVISGEPTREKYEKVLQSEFKQHFKHVHVHMKRDARHVK